MAKTQHPWAEYAFIEEVTYLDNRVEFHIYNTDPKDSEEKFHGGKTVYKQVYYDTLERAVKYLDNWYSQYIRRTIKSTRRV